MELVAAVLYSLDILVLASFQFRARGYGLFAHAVSDYGVGPTAAAFRAYLLIGSLAAPLLAWQFWQAANPAYPASIPAYLLLVMVARVALALYPNDLRGQPRTRTGHIHQAATLVGFTAAWMTVAEATPLLAATGGVAGTFILALKHLISAGFIAVMLTVAPPARHFFGLAERLFLYATALWFLTASLALPPL